MDKQDLVVIGGGTSGFIVATGALRLGLKVVLIESKARLGGSALHAGCVPSKTLLHVAQISQLIQDSKQYGLESTLLPTDLDKVNKHVSKIVSGLEKQESRELQHIFKQLGGQILFGHAKFIDAHTIQLDTQKITAKKFVLATGSRPLYPAIKGLDDVGYITNDTVFSQSNLPQHLIVLGGKPAAIEFAQAFARLGSKVTVVVRDDNILLNEEPELVNKLKELLINDGIDFYMSTTVQEVYLQKEQKFLECMHDSGDKFVLSADEILVSLGRKPNIEGLGLENAGVEYRNDGILVNRKLRTSRKNIYALGDVIRSPYKLTHVAEYQASILLSNALFYYPAKVKYQGFPYVIFTSPEYAHVGLSEAQAKDLGYRNLDILRFEFKDLDSAIIQSAQSGSIKVVTRNGKIIGATILGPQASNLIAEWGLAINLGAHIQDVAQTIHAYPTLAQINKRVASKQITRSLFSLGNRRLVRMLQRVFA